MLVAVKQFAPTIFPYVLSCYSSPSTLFWEDYVIESGEGVQQIDPLGPLLFCLPIHEVTQSLKSQFCVLHLDDLSLGGNVETLTDDLQTILLLESYGLHLNTSKSEVITDNSTTFNLFTSSFPNSIRVHSLSASLLCSPLGDLDCVSASRSLICLSWGTVCDLLLLIILLRYSFAIPKLMYLLRTAPCSVLCEFDECLCSVDSTITNVSCRLVTSLITSMGRWVGF